MMYITTVSLQVAACIKDLYQNYDTLQKLFQPKLGSHIIKAVKYFCYVLKETRKDSCARPNLFRKYAN